LPKQEIPLKERAAWALFTFKFIEKQGFRSFLEALVKDFIVWSDPETGKVLSSIVNYFPWNREGYIYGFKIKDKVFPGYKMYYFDNNHRTNSPFALLFRDHYDEDFVANVMLVAGEFKRFLRERNIKFELFYRHK